MGLGLMAGINAALGLGGGVMGKIKHDEYANLLEDQELNMPGAMGSAESIYQGLASQGLPGKETIQDSIDATIPGTLSAAKEVVDSPSALLDLLSKSSSNVAAQTRNLGVQDAQARTQNESMLADFYTRAKAPMEMQINQFDIQKTLDAERERMLGWSELFGGASQAGQVGMQYFANKQSHDDMKELINDIYGGGDGGGGEQPSFPKSSDAFDWGGDISSGRSDSKDIYYDGRTLSGRSDSKHITYPPQSPPQSPQPSGQGSFYDGLSINAPAPPNRGNVWGLTKQYLEAIGQYDPQKHIEMQQKMFEMNGMPNYNYNNPSAMYGKDYWLTKGKKYKLPWGGDFIAE